MGSFWAEWSGRQRQRIAIARALATVPRILILDEATAALDYESERQFQKNMKAVEKNRTVISIAHRLSTIRNADRIIVMDQGQQPSCGPKRLLIFQHFACCAETFQSLGNAAINCDNVNDCPNFFWCDAIINGPLTMQFPFVHFTQGANHGQVHH